jgi:hypothetical protein
VRFDRRNAWSDSEAKIATEIFTEAQARGGFGWKSRAFSAIAKKLGRQKTSVENRFVNNGGAFSRARMHVAEHAEGKAPDYVIAERERRIEAINRRTPTQEFFGDPPPGYSALDRKNGADTTSPTKPSYGAPVSPSRCDDDSPAVNPRYSRLSTGR